MRASPCRAKPSAASPTSTTTRHVLTLRWELGAGDEARASSFLSIPPVAHDASRRSFGARRDANRYRARCDADSAVGTPRAGRRRVRRHARHPAVSTARAIIAGYPWFTDWGRDAMISLPGLLLGTRARPMRPKCCARSPRFATGGLIPNRFPDAEW